MLIPANKKVSLISPTVFLIKNYITKPRIVIGDYTYYNDFNGESAAIDFENKNILYYFPDFIEEELIIGKFCSIGQGVLFIMNGGNHNYNNTSTYPFYLLKENISSKEINSLIDYSLIKTPTIIGHDVWIGHDVTIMRGVKVGNGCVIAAKSVVSKDIPDYAIVAGNPARVIKYRFNEKVIAQLQKMQWWNWPIEKIEANLNLLENNISLELLKKISY